MSKTDARLAELKTDCVELNALNTRWLDRVERLEQQSQEIAVTLFSLLADGNNEASWCMVEAFICRHSLATVEELRALGNPFAMLDGMKGVANVLQGDLDEARAKIKELREAYE